MDLAGNWTGDGWSEHYLAPGITGLEIGGKGDARYVYNM